MYAGYIKRVLDFLLALLGLMLLSPLFLVLTVVGTLAMKGNPFFFQLRPGKDERIFKLIKFRSMTRETDANGRLLPDARRLTRYGRFLRASSLDELPELLNIVKGDMALVGPRPLLVRDMVFMTPAQRKRHSVRPGLTGLAQVSGRNALRWENKLAYDLQYLTRISFWNDFKIILKTVRVVLLSRGVADDGMETSEDFGDYLLRSGAVNREHYDRAQREAEELLGV